MLFGFLILIGCQLLGEIISGFFDLPIPGAVIGMLLLFAGLLVRGHVPEGVQQVERGLLRHIGLLFVPAGAGISAYLGLLHDQWLVILVASATSTLATILICAGIFLALKQEHHDGT